MDIHGTGLASAADYAAAVRRLVFDGDMTMESLIAMLDSNYVGYDDIRSKILNEFPKMGNNQDETDEIANGFLAAFALGCGKLKNERGGCYRAGTGSAMYYISHAQDIGATADGRLRGDYLPANYSPSLNIPLNGPFSIIQSFTKPDLSKTINGGPLTLEFASVSIRNQLGKLALLVKGFIDLGGHQLQLNVGE